MCTVTWLYGAGGYELLFNRDERRTRGPASSPSLKQRAGVSYLSPTDADAGGTWIGVNEYGLTLCVLNHHPTPPQEQSDAPRSRGHLVDELLSATRLAEVRTAIEARPLEPYRPFILVALAPQEPLTSWTWDTQRLLPTPLERDARHLTTSSFDSDGVRARRAAVFHQFAHDHGGVDREMLLAFHRQHDLKAPAYSVCMSRPDACTVSFTHIEVTADTVCLRYSPTPPCRTPEVSLEPWTLPRKALSEQVP